MIDVTLKHTPAGEAARPQETPDAEQSEFSSDSTRAQCISCGHQGLEPILDLGRMPRSDGLLEAIGPAQTETLVPLRLGYCPGCTLVQLLETRPAEEMFGDDYVYFSSYSEDLLKHSRENAEELIRTHGLGPDSLVAEIASNDGYMLQNFQAQGIQVLGIDPASQPARAAREKGIETVVDFFGTRVAAGLRAQGKRADVIIANNVVAHVADQNDLVAGMADLLADNGTVVVEFPYVRDMIDFIEFDTIYHEHLCYFSAGSAKALFERHGLYLNDVRRLPIHGGSLRLYFSKCAAVTDAVQGILAEEHALGLDRFEYYKTFGARVRAFRDQARKLVGTLKADGKRIAAYGAAAKGTIMLNFLNLNDRAIEYAVDKNIHKQGKYMPGVRIRIDEPEKLMQDKPDYVMILPWNFRDEIIRQQRAFLEAGGKFVVPIPDLEIVSAPEQDSSR
ncbi:methyltransferase domain-containing protein [Leisingera caerulea]|uniref:methyltransferase domain-containing protein n=2 Tax=Leisingera caerulea TaxID=506591 RepID=UPI0035CD2615